MKKLNGMKYLVWLLFGLMLYSCSNKPANHSQKMRTITDMAGRKVEIPEHIKTAFVDRHSVQMVYAFDTILPVNRVFNYTVMEKRYLKKSFYANKPYVIEGATEEIMRLHPDVVLYSQPLTPENIDEVNVLQKKINIPVILMNADITKYKQTLAFLGMILDKEGKAAELIGFIKKRIDPIFEQAKKIPIAHRKRVYYAEGMKGLNTDPSGSVHSLLIDMLGAKNVAQTDVLPGKGMSSVSIEQIYKWNPDMIVVWSGNFDSMDSYRCIKSSVEWKKLPAVERNAVYQVPWRPFGWIDRPPGINRLIGVAWLAHLLYPQYFHTDVETITKEYFDKFCHYTISDKELKEILNPQPKINK
jgi:iron complex transport system substrate-binding protein